MIRATRNDRAEIEAFLLERAAGSMFPLSNLRRYGMDGGHDRACSFWIRRDAGRITDVLTMSDMCSLFPQCPNGFLGLRSLFQGLAVPEILGPAEQVATLRSELGLEGPGQLDTTEPGYRLLLSEVEMPDVTGCELRSLDAVPLETLISWRASYCIESLGVLPGDAPAKAAKDIESYIANDTHRSLFFDRVPVGMTGFNAVLPEIVQIGGVYTPPEFRGRGFARRSLAMHLAEARDTGVEEAVLFAANPAAERAYLAIGFKPADPFSIVVFDPPRVVDG